MTQREKESRMIGMERRFDISTVLRDILQNWLSILLIAATVGMAAYMMLAIQYQGQYTTRATLFVTARGTGNSIYNNQYSAVEVAAKFSQILNSQLLQRQVAQEMGESAFAGSAKAEVVEHTNLLEVSVSADTPERSFLQMQAILNNYQKVSHYLLEDAVLEVLQAPVVPSRPDEPFAPGKRVEQSVLAAILSVSLLLGCTSFFKDTVRREQEVEQKLDTKRLVTIAHERKYKTIGTRLRGKKESILITDPTISFRYTETVRKLARRVLVSMDHRHAKILLVSSVLENEGKSTVAANLALAIAQESRRVLLMDCDFRRPAQYKILHMQEVEFADFGAVLKGEVNAEHFIQKMPGMSLYMLLNKNAYADPAELIESERFQRVLSFLREEMDVIIIDTAPMAMTADVEELAEQAEAALLITKQHLARVRDLNDAIDVLDGSGEKLLGCVFQDVPLGMFEQTRERVKGYGYGGHYEQSI